METYEIKNLPFIGNMITNQTTDEENNNEKLVNNKLYEQYSKELENNQNLIENFQSISTELIKMGFSPKIVLRSFLVFKYSTLDQGIEVLSKSENLWNHKFIEGFNNKCFVCEELENGHRSIRNIWVKKKTLNLNDEKIKLALNKLPSMNIETKSAFTFLKADLCPICFIEINNDFTFSLNCKHKFCKECIILYLEEEIKNGRVNSILCPQGKCEEDFTQEITQNLVDQITYEKYFKFLEREKIKNISMSINCPIVNCEGFALKQDYNSNEQIELDNPNSKLLEKNEIVLKISTIKEKIKYVCNNGHFFCGNCKNIWHEDDCNEDKEVKEFATSTGHIIKKCYKCRVWTEKNEGCNHMTCQICKFEWCWLCEQPCDPNHFSTPGPCLGRQFNEVPDTILIDLMQFQQNNQCLWSFFFIFYLSCLIISQIINRNFDENNQNPRRIYKCTIFTSILLISSILWIISILFNGIIFIYMITSLLKMNGVPNFCSRITCLLTFMVLFIPFYFIGILISTLWLIIIIFYTVFKLILA